jgi:DNA invertase Pin-like site-specific DNA recombinase
MTVYVAYLRVSTDKQGRSGLGLEAQQTAIAGFLKPDDKLLEPPFIEVESGKRSDRPQLHAALERCRKTGATLLIAKLDRLARNVAFIANLMESGVPFVAVDMPHADPFRLHIEAAIAEDEARKISQRTKAALKAAKERGVTLGGYRGGPIPDIREVQAKGAEAARQKSDTFAVRLAPVIADIRAAGMVSLRQIADELNRRGVPTARGGNWAAPAVRNVLARIDQEA